MTKQGDILIGGGFFTHDQISLGKLIANDKSFKCIKLVKDDILKPRIKLKGDYTVLLGIKGIERILRKARLNKQQIFRRMTGFLKFVIPRKKPLIVVDDWSLPLMQTYGRKTMKFLFAKFDVRLYLLREYLNTDTYPDKVVPFSLPSNDYQRFIIPAERKNTDIFFQGNVSHKDRSRVVKILRGKTKNLRCYYKLMTGGTKNTKDRLPFKKFLKTMAKSHICLSFSGSGYDCYRYHEIPSVGSIVASPKYPLVIRNDYEDMKSKISYKNVEELVKKTNRICGSSDLLAEMQSNANDRFRRFHTSEKRFDELKNYIEGVV